jgi:hypothetical protein
MIRDHSRSGLGAGISHRNCYGPSGLTASLSAVQVMVNGVHLMLDFSQNLMTVCIKGPKHSLLWPTSANIRALQRTVCTVSTSSRLIPKARIIIYYRYMGDP